MRLAKVMESVFKLLAEAEGHPRHGTLSHLYTSGCDLGSHQLGIAGP